MQWYSTWKRRASKITRGNNWRNPRFLKAQFSSTYFWRNVALVGLVGIVAGVLAVAGLFAWYARDLPQPDRIVRKEGFSTKILDSKGQLLYEVFADQQRTPVKLEQVSDYMKKATISIEDKSFYTHGGFDPKGYLRAIFTIITQRRLVGGSTLTQQLVKNVLLTSDKTLPRKIKEFILAVQIESKYNKDEILQMYLNEVPYGGTAWGVATASQMYYGKDPASLTMLESAILAGMPQRPSYYSPYSGNPEAFKGRTKDVLRRMREDGHISREEEEQALKELQDFKFRPKLTSIKAPHFVLYVKQKLVDLYGESLVEQGGLKVTTTLDLELQEKAQMAVTEEIDKVAKQGIGNGAAVVMDPTTGNILAMVGSKNYFAEDYDGQYNVVTAKRQPGSTIKPVTYAAALMKGYTPATMLMDVPTQFPGATPDKPYEPVNYDGKFRGPVQLRFALGSSLNIPAVKLLALVGVKDMLSLAYDLGFNTLEPTNENMQRFGLSVTLGGGEVRLLDLATAYSAFGNGGTKVEPTSILKVEDRDGKVLFEHKPMPGKRVVGEDVAFLINHMLSDNNARLLTFGANSYLNMNGRPVAVKTGTTNDRKDNWTVGWSRSAIVGVWVGNNDNTPMKQVASGTTGASPIWRRIMLDSLTKYPAKDWEVPQNVEAIHVDQISGYPEHDGFPARAEYVIKDTVPPLPDPVHTKVKLCRGQDKLATELDVARNEFEEKEFIVAKEDMKLGKTPSWQEAIDAWVKSQADGRFRVPTEYCGNTIDEVAVKVDTPSDKQNFDGNEVKIVAKITTAGEVDKVEVLIGGNVRETIAERPYETTITLPTGKYTMRIRATRKDGKTGESGDIRIGVGGTKWDEGMATPTPGPSPTGLLDNL